MDKRRFERVPVAVSIEILVLRSGGDATVAGPVPATVVDISPAGAGLILTAIRAETTHLFYGPQEDPGLFLSLRFTGEDGTRQRIRAVPVWFNKELDGDPVFYRLGISFAEPTSSPAVQELLRIMKADGRIGRWLRELFGESA